MAHINLLPWRVELRKQRQNEFASMAGLAAILGVLLVLMAHMRLNGMINGQEARNDYLRKEIKTLDEKIAKIKDLESVKNKLLARMNVIQELQRNRPLSVRLADELVRSLPDGVYLTRFEQKAQDLLLDGVAQSNARVSAYMRNIDSSDWLSNPRLTVIETKQTERTRVGEFKLQANQRPEKKPPVSEEGTEDTDVEAGAEPTAAAAETPAPAEGAQ